MTKVFVYGTLQRGYGNSRLFAAYNNEESEGKFVTKATTVDSFRVENCGFPMAKLDPNGSKVSGEVWEATEENMRRLDQLEGHPDFYTRTPTRVETEEGEIEEVEMYHINSRSLEMLRQDNTPGVVYQWGR